MSTILFATDFSDTAALAGRTAATLARHIGATLRCVHAVVMTDAQPDGYEVASGHLEEFRKLLQKDIATRRARLAALAEEYAREGIETSHELLDGPVVESLCREAEAAGANLVVVGSHGRTGLRRMLLGSVAERVVRLCTTSVLVAREQAEESDGFRRVLAATDFSDLAEVALDQATTLAAPDATIDILHTWLLDEFPDGTLAPLDRGATHSAVAKAVTKKLGVFGQHLVERVNGTGRTASFHLIEGRPTAALHSYLDESPPYDLIAVGTHGRTGLQRLFLGSVAESVVRYAPCSVLVARVRT